MHRMQIAQEHFTSGMFFDISANFILYLVVANGAAIITVTCQMVSEFCYPKEASQHGVVDTLKIHSINAGQALP